jgi:hypothetical protein
MFRKLTKIGTYGNIILGKIHLIGALKTVACYKIYQSKMGLKKSYKIK